MQEFSYLSLQFISGSIPELFLQFYIILKLVISEINNLTLDILC